MLFYDGSYCHPAEACVDRSYTQRAESKRVLYLKTHKTGSSSVSGILWRELCIRRHMNCFLPTQSIPGRTWDLGDQQEHQYVTESLGTNLSHFPFDVWVNHVHHTKALADFMRSPYLLVSSVRRPGDRFQSAWNYFQIGGHRGVSQSKFIDMLHERVANGFNDLSEKLFVEKWYKYAVGLEATSQEITGAAIDAETFAASFQDVLRRVFDYRLFLIVCDRFDESILVLRWLLEWPMDVQSHEHYLARRRRPFVRNITQAASGADMTSWDRLDGGEERHFKDENIWYVPQKVSSTSSSASGKPQELFKAEDLSLLDVAQPHDMLLYNVANEALDKLIGFYGKERFTDDLQAYRARLQRIQAHCAQYDIRTTCSAFTPMRLQQLQARNVSKFLLDRISKKFGTEGYNDECISFGIRLLVNASSAANTHQTPFLYTFHGYAEAATVLPDDVYTCWNMRLDNVQYVKLFWKHLIDGHMRTDPYFASHLIDHKHVMNLARSLERKKSHHAAWTQETVAP